MAKIVLGIGASQSPLVSIPGEHWGDHGKIDMVNDRLFKPDGTRISYEQLAADTGDSLKEIVSAPHFIKTAAFVAEAVERLCADLARARPDVLIVIGDDQTELFDRSNIPAVAIYRGAELSNNPKELAAGAPQWRHDRRNDVTISADRHYPAAPDFADEIIEHLIAKEFDVAAVSQPPNPAKGIGHSWAFVANHLAAGRVIPIVPVLLNTWYPPNVPTPARCHKLGLALRAAIEESRREVRVAVVAPGGLSHPIINEKLDREVMTAIRAGDSETLINLPRTALRGGAGQILDWITMVGAVGGLNNQWAEYWPVYRTPGGTGIDLAFASWF